LAPPLLTAPQTSRLDPPLLAAEVERAAR